jgi:phosphate transport system substrate-binding protein
MRLTKRTCTILAVILILYASGGVAAAAETEEPALSGTISISGAWALYPMVVRWAEEFNKVHPGVRIDIAAGGAGKGMADALAGAVDLGMVSRDVHPAEVERGAWWVSVTKDAVVPVVCEANPVIDRLLVSGMTREAFASIWIAEEAGTWGDVVENGPRHPLRAYTRSDACGAAQTWAQYLGGTQEDLLGVGVYGDPGLADAVRRDALGIGFNNINYVYDAETKKPVAGLRVVPIDLNANGTIDEEEDFYGSRDHIVNAIAAGLYPSPPARDLHLVSRGRPTQRAVVEFLSWILTEGQALVHEAGYIRLADDRLAEDLARLRGTAVGEESE